MAACGQIKPDLSFVRDSQNSGCDLVACHGCDDGCIRHACDFMRRRSAACRLFERMQLRLRTGAIAATDLLPRYRGHAGYDPAATGYTSKGCRLNLGRWPHPIPACHHPVEPGQQGIIRRWRGATIVSGLSGDPLLMKRAVLPRFGLRFTLRASILKSTPTVQTFAKPHFH